MPAYKELELVASAARTSSGESALLTLLEGTRIESDGSIRIYLDVTAASGTTPTLDVDVVAVIGGVEMVLQSFAQKTAAGQETIVVPQCPRAAKVKWTIGGTTPSFTFSVQASRF